MIENCIIDYKNSVLIPQNETENFIIKPHSKWKYAIEINFNIKNDIDYVSLYFIIKSYCDTSILKSYAICTMFIDKELKNVISENEYMFKFKNMDFDKFYEWINYRIKNDWKYNTSSDFYGILILFEKNICLLKSKDLGVDILSFLKPIYPWTPEWLETHKKSILEKEILKKEIEYYKNLVKK